MLRIADSILGSNLLERVAEFLLDLRTTYDGVAQRGREIEKVMKTSSIIVVTTADPAPVREAVRFYRELPQIASTPAAVIFNRTLPESWMGVRVPDSVSAAMEHVAEMWSTETQRQHDAREEFAARHGAHIATVPWSETPPNDLDSLASLMDQAKNVPWRQLGFEPT
jgi:anion-transporting  ArsA/GET3 family ATPase